MINFILFKALFLIGVLQAELPSDGWIAVDRTEKEPAPMGADESDPSIWVIFAKEMGSEKYLSASLPSLAINTRRRTGLEWKYRPFLQAASIGSLSENPRMIY